MSVGMERRCSECGNWLWSEQEECPVCDDDEEDEEADEQE